VPPGVEVILEAGEVFLERAVGAGVARRGSVTFGKHRGCRY